MSSSSPAIPTSSAPAADPFKDLGDKLKSLSNDALKEEKASQAKANSKTVLQKLMDEVKKGQDALAKSSDAVHQEIKDSDSAINGPNGAKSMLDTRLSEDLRNGFTEEAEKIDQNVGDVRDAVKSRRDEVPNKNMDLDKARAELTLVDAELTALREQIAKFPALVTTAQTNAAKYRNAMNTALNAGKDEEAWTQMYLLNKTIGELNDLTKDNQQWNKLLTDALNAHNDYVAKQEAFTAAATNSALVANELTDVEKQLQSLEQNRLNMLKEQVDRLYKNKKER